MNNKLLIISTIYNSLELVRGCVEHVKKNTTGDYEHILVFNHPPCPNVKEYIDLSGATVFDPNENIGCHRGFNFALSFRENHNITHVVKLDDDTLVPKNWNEPMMECLELDQDLAYISSINDSAKQGFGNLIERQLGKYTIQIPKSGCVGFSCVMFPIETLNKIGTLSKINTLYGGEELDFLERVKAANKYGAYLKENPAFHLDNENRDVDFVLWKFVYGFQGFTNKDFVEFKRDRQELIKGYTCWANNEDNKTLQKIGKEQLEKIYNS